MNKIFSCLILFFIFFQKESRANTSVNCNKSRIVKTEIIENSNGIVIEKNIREDGTFFYNIIAAIATIFLPEIVEGVCNSIIDDPDACNIAYKATTTLVAIRGVNMYKGIFKGISYFASKGSYRSFAQVETASYNFAKNVKKAFEIYKDLGCVKWNDVDYSYSNENKDNYATGRLIFFSDCPYKISIWVNGNFVGETSKYFTQYNYAPNCGTEGCITVNGYAGYIKYYAKAYDGSVWNGEVYINAGACTPIKLNK